MMRSKFAVWTLCLAVALVVVFAGSLWAQPACGGGRWGGIGAAQYLDRSWTAVSFAIELTPEQVTNLRPTFGAAWKTRVEVMQKVMAAAQGPDRQAAMQEALPIFQQIKTDIDAKLKEVLTADQAAVVTPLLAQGPRPNNPPPAPAPAPAPAQ